LRALAEFDFLPRPEDLARKKGVRGRELERALTEARVAPSYALRRQAPSEMVQLSSLFEGALSSENLKALRDQHLGRQALATQQMRQLNNALEATGLQGMPWTRASNVRNPGIIE
jgi:IS5 family transposase